MINLSVYAAELWNPDEPGGKAADPAGIYQLATLPSHLQGAAESSSWKLQQPIAIFYLP